MDPGPVSHRVTPEDLQACPFSTADNDDAGRWDECGVAPPARVRPPTNRLHATTLPWATLQRYAPPPASGREKRSAARARRPRQREGNTKAGAARDIPAPTGRRTRCRNEGRSRRSRMEPHGTYTTKYEERLDRWTHILPITRRTIKAKNPATSKCLLRRIRPTTRRWLPGTEGKKFRGAICNGEGGDGTLSVSPRHLARPPCNDEPLINQYTCLLRGPAPAPCFHAAPR
ncbi:hypothetical protein BSTEL_1334 [Bifidobacterium stellenboschense]|uniref:Uncharacterized protein n=1 Tax=Bifidobacterium stellenboschense TaxID=762211 RepID=A0A087DTF7_9BIFI|nr:hypothetical protein BSTEL_1334 [Bifidobacterium stellenboschense]